MEKKSRKLGVLEGTSNVIFKDNFKFETEEEFVYGLDSIEHKKAIRKLGLLNGTKGYFKADYFKETTEEEFPV